MLITALGPVYQLQFVHHFSYLDVPNTIDDICWYVARAAWVARSYLEAWYFDAEAALVAIASYPGMDLREQLQLRMSRLRKKHLERADGIQHS